MQGNYDTTQAPFGPQQRDSYPHRAEALQHLIQLAIADHPPELTWLASKGVMWNVRTKAHLADLKHA